MINFWSGICRGKYRSPNALPDGERPLYLHISAAAHVSNLFLCMIWKLLKIMDKTLGSDVGTDSLLRSTLISQLQTFVLRYEILKSTSLQNKLMGINCLMEKL